MKRKILLGLAIVLVGIQFIRPTRNESATIASTDINLIRPIPGNVQLILKKACNDCHTNNSQYPWYSNIQPVGWWMANHINEGKKELNFAEFATYSQKKQQHKLKEIAETVKSGEMPIESYTWTHKDALLSAGEKEQIIRWADSLRATITIRE